MTRVAFNFAAIGDDWKRPDVDAVIAHKMDIDLARQARACGKLVLGDVGPHTNPGHWHHLRFWQNSFGSDGFWAIGPRVYVQDKPGDDSWADFAAWAWTVRQYRINHAPTKEHVVMALPYNTVNPSEGLAGRGMCLKRYPRTWGAAYHKKITHITSWSTYEEYLEEPPLLTGPGRAHVVEDGNGPRLIDEAIKAARERNVAWLVLA